MTTFVWDTTVLLHAHRADRLDVLGDLAGDHNHLINDVVAAELTKCSAEIPRWVRTTAFTSFADIAMFVSWRDRVANPPHDLGEAATLALVNLTPQSIGILDDARAIQTARAWDLNVHGSLWLVAQAVTEGRWNVLSVSGWCDALLTTGIRWPFQPGGFGDWAASKNLL